MSYPKLAPGIETAKKISENPVADPAPAAASAQSSLQDLDRSLHSAMASYTGGLAPAVLASAFFDWYSHLLFSPANGSNCCAWPLNAISRIARSPLAA